MDSLSRASAEAVPLLKTLIAEEGWRVTPYRCTAGALTIGVGHNLDASGLCEAAIVAQLLHDVEVARRGAKRLCLRFWGKLNEARQDAIILWVFQLGEAGVAEFAPTLALIEQGRYAAAADRMMKSKWARQTPLRVRRLAKMLERGTHE